MNILKKLTNFEAVLNWVELKYTQPIKEQIEIAIDIYGVLDTTNTLSVLDELEEYLKLEYGKSANHWRCRDTYKITLEKLQALKEM